MHQPPRGLVRIPGACSQIRRVAWAERGAPAFWLAGQRKGFRRAKPVDRTLCCEWVRRKTSGRKEMLKGFRDFILRGNVVDLA
ncbi:MAG: hypothetical protein WBM14_05955, partial [Terracidiphilus sp.]